MEGSGSGKRCKEEEEGVVQEGRKGGKNERIERGERECRS